MDWFQQNARSLLLGQMLVRENLISQSQLQRAIAQQKKTGQRLGDVIYECELVPKKMVDAVLRKQRTMRIVSCVAAVLLAPIPMPGHTSKSPVVVNTITTKNTLHTAPRRERVSRLPKQDFYEITEAASIEGLEVVEVEFKNDFEFWAAEVPGSELHTGKRFDYWANV